MTVINNNISVSDNNLTKINTTVVNNNLSEDNNKKSNVEKVKTDSIEISEQSKADANKKKAFDAFKAASEEMSGGSNVEGESYLLKMFLMYDGISDEMSKAGFTLPSFAPGTPDCSFLDSVDEMKKYVDNKISSGTAFGDLSEFSQFLDVYKKKLIEYGCN